MDKLAENDYIGSSWCRFPCSKVPFNGRKRRQIGPKLLRDKNKSSSVGSIPRQSMYSLGHILDMYMEGKEEMKLTV